MNLKSDRVKIVLACSALVIAAVVFYFNIRGDDGGAGVDWSEALFECSACANVFSLSSAEIKQAFTEGRFMSADAFVAPCPKCGQDSRMVRKCSNCGAHCPASAPQCPECGWGVSDEIRQKYGQ